LNNNALIYSPDAIKTKFPNRGRVTRLRITRITNGPKKALKKQLNYEKIYFFHTWQRQMFSEKFNIVKIGSWGRLTWRRVRYCRRGGRRPFKSGGNLAHDAVTSRPIATGWLRCFFRYHTRCTGSLTGD